MKALKIVATIYALLVLTWIAWSLNWIALKSGRMEVQGVNEFPRSISVKLAP